MQYYSLFHIDRFEHVHEAANKVDGFNVEYLPELMFAPHLESPII